MRCTVQDTRRWASTTSTGAHIVLQLGQAAKPGVPRDHNARADATMADCTAHFTVLHFMAPTRLKMESTAGLQDAYAMASRCTVPRRQKYHSWTNAPSWYPVALMMRSFMRAIDMRWTGFLPRPERTGTRGYPNPNPNLNTMRLR